MQQESDYGFTVGNEVICNGKIDVIVDFIDDKYSKEYEQGYRLILKEEGNQALSSVKRKLVKWPDLYGNDGDILLPQIRYFYDKKVHNRVECPNCLNEMYDSEPSTIYESCPSQTAIECECGFKSMRYVSDEKDHLELTLELQNQFPLVSDIWQFIDANPYLSLAEIVERIKSTNERVQNFRDKIKAKAKLAQTKTIQDNLIGVTRLEVISPEGRQYVNVNISELELSFQDDGRTLKLFIK